MFCPNCGAKNEDSARFCEQCGYTLSDQIAEEPEKMAETAPLSQATGPVGEESAAQAVKKVPDYQPAGPAAENQNIFQPETVKAPKKKNSARTIVTAVEAFLLIAVCFLCYRQIEKINNPETVIHTYMDAIMEQDWDMAYNCLSLPDSPYLTAEAYRRAVASGEMVGITNYRVEKKGKEGKKDSKNDFAPNFQVQYMKKGNSQKMETMLQSVSSREKKWLILEDWKISPVDALVADVQIYAYPMMEVTVDGVLLGPDTAKVEEGQADITYTIPYLFAGSHVIEVAAEGFEPYSEEIVLNDLNDFVSLELPYIKEETMGQLAEQTGELWNSFLQGIVDDKIPEFVTAEMMDAYDSSKYRYELSGNDSTITEINLDQIAASLEDSGWDEGKFYVVVQLTAPMNITGQYGRYQGFGRPMSYETITDSGYGSFRAAYFRVGSTWELADFGADFR